MATPDPVNKRPRSTTGKFTRSMDTAERDAQAAHLRSEGKSLDEIASLLGYADRSGAKRAVDRAFGAVAVGPVEDLRSEETAKLDRLAVEAWNVIHAEHHKTSPSGRVIVHPITGEPLDDPGPRLTALNTLLKVADRRAKLLGIDMPARAQVEATVSVETAAQVIDAHIADLKAKIAAEEQRQAEESKRWLGGPPEWHPEQLE